MRPPPRPWQERPRQQRQVPAAEHRHRARERAGREGETAGLNSLNAILQVEQTKVQAKAREVILNRKLQGLTGA